LTGCVDAAGLAAAGACAGFLAAGFFAPLVAPFAGTILEDMPLDNECKKASAADSAREKV
jgi:hypothetical protein